MTSVDNSTLRLIDPIFIQAKLRAEFRLPANSVFQSNLRILGTGITSNVADSYSPTLGANGAISAIHIYDGGMLLDSITDFNTYSSWKNLNKTNDSNISQNRRLDYVGLGFCQDGVQSATANQLDDDDYTLKAQNPVADNIGKGSWLNLRSCLAFLRSSIVLPTNVYRQLRVVLTFKSAEALKDAVRDRRDGTLGTNTGLVLACDEVDEGDVKEAMKKNYNGVVYSPYEFDAVNLPAVAGTANTNDGTRVIATNNDFLVHGFNNKKLKRLLVVHKPTDNTTWVNGNVNKGYGNNASQALFREALNIRINGVNKLAGDGVTGKNRRLAMLTDTFGDVNIIQGQQYCATQDFNNYVSGANTLQATQGAVDYAGVICEDYINTLQIFLNRSGVYDNAGLNQQIRVILMGEVEKAVIMNSDGTYRIVYTQ
jgi:hypothetical protein